MAKLLKKVSPHILRQLPDFVIANHPVFAEFLRTYFVFLESAEMKLESIASTDGILQETETTLQNLILLNGTKITSDITVVDDGDKVLLESSVFGKFVNNETIVGSVSNASTLIVAEDISNTRLFVVHDDKFIIGETITGQTSGAQAVVKEYKPNPVQNIQELLNFKDPDRVIDGFLSKFRDEFLQTIPETLAPGLNKRNLIKNIKSLYTAKGTSTGHEMFFRLLFNEKSETIYPKENMIRVSDGKWDSQLVMRCIATTGDTLKLIGRTITQPNDPGDANINEATAVIENAFKFQIGSNEITEFILNSDSVVGTFVVGQSIQGTELDTDTLVIKASITGIPSSVTVTNDGSLYSQGDTITVTDTGGTSAIMQVEEVGNGTIEEIFVNNAGSNYEIGDNIVFDNTSTGGGGASAKVAIVNGAIIQESAVSSQPDHIITDDHIILETETTRGDPFTGNKIVQESGTGSGDITDVRIINSGAGYSSLPTLTITSTSGSGATVLSKGSQIGRILTTKFTDLGAEYENSPTPPTLSFTQNLLLRGISGTFSVDETITGNDSSSTVITGIIESKDEDTGVFKIKSATGTFEENSSITGGTSGAFGIIVSNDRATATTTVGSTTQTSGSFINEDGHLSEDTMRIQDSLYYQDFSYVIKVGRSINEWRDSFQKTMHTAGFYYQGQVNIVSQIDAKIKTPVEGITSGSEITPLFRILDFIFSGIVGRRLGTTDDGTTLRSDSHVEVDADTRSTNLTPTTRDVTLKRELKYLLTMKEKTTIRSNTTVFGRPVSNTLRGLNSRLLNLHTALRIQIRDIADIRLSGLQNQSLDGELIEMGDFSFHAKTNFAIPAEVFQQSGNSFDETGTRFDSTTIKFDKA